MPPAAKRNGSVILFDVKTSADFAEAASQCLINICALNWFFESKDTTKILLLNTEETNNVVNSKFEGKCPHVSEATDVIGYNPKLLKPLVEDVATAEADWLMGLAVALEELKDNFFEAKGIMNLQLLFITDFSTPVAPKEKRIEFAIKNINKLGVRLYILGPEVQVPNYMSSFEDIQQWSSNIEFLDEEESNPNLAIAKRIVKETKGVICGLQLGQDLFNNYFERWGKQPWKVPLTVGSSLTVQTSTTRFLKSGTMPRIKGEALEGYREPWKWHLVDDVSAEVPYENVIGGVFRHGKFVALPADVEKDFKYVGPRGFKLIGFTDLHNIPEFYMRGDGSNFVESDNSANFELLVHVLAKQNKCAIAQKIYNANCKPKLVALLPQPQERIFILVELPYGDSIKASFVEQSLSEAPKLESDPLVKAMHEYLLQCDLSDPNNRDENGSVKVPLAASLMTSYRLSVVAKQCLRKYLGENMDQEASKITLPQFLDDSPYKEFVPVREAPEPKKKAAD